MPGGGQLQLVKHTCGVPAQYRRSSWRRVDPGYCSFSFLRFLRWIGIKYLLSPLHLSITDRLCKVGFQSCNTEGCHSQDEGSFAMILKIEHRVAGRVERQIDCTGLGGR